MPALVAVVGRQASGKTRVVCGLLQELTARGRRVGAVKHAREGFQLDLEGKDSWRHAQAGAEPVALSSTRSFALLRKQDDEATLEQIRDEHFWGCDLVIGEGFRESAVPKIEVLPAGEAPTAPAGDLIALVLEESPDSASSPPAQAGLPTFRLDQMKELADLLEARLLRCRKPGARLLVDGKPVPLTSFPAACLRGTMAGFISSLRGVPARPREVWLRLRLDAAPQESSQEEQGDQQSRG